MTDYDNRGKTDLWKNSSDNPNAPVLKGKISDKRQIAEKRAEPKPVYTTTGDDEGYDDEIPF